MSVRICIYCGAKTPENEYFVNLAKQLGRNIAEQGWELVFGGGKVGMMGLTADAALKAGGKVTGIIPTALKRAEIAHSEITNLHITNDMHSRKAMMESLSDAFIALPGGFGTLDEFFEILTWRQLGFHQKPVVLLNTDGYFDGIIDFVERARVEKMIYYEHTQMFKVTTGADETINYLKKYFR